MLIHSTYLLSINKNKYCRKEKISISGEGRRKKVGGQGEEGRD
jgi:hypothetical protein